MPSRKKKKKNRLSAVLLVAVTVVIVVVGLVTVRDRRQRLESEKTAFATSETQTPTDPLGKFPDFPVGKTPDSWASDGTDLAEPDPSAAGQASTASASTAPAPTVSADPTATVPNTSSTTMTNQTVHNYSEGAEYAYAYAGFMPRQADLNISEWNLLLVNRNYILPQDYSPQLAEAVSGSGVELDARAAPEYQRMFDAARNDGITLTPLSGYRRISTQKTNFENKIQYYMDQGYDKAEATRKAATIILPPGTSEHNAGLAMDIISLDVDFEETEAFAWLQEHAQDYGFILRYPKNKESITQITYEPWHWRYVGKKHAQAIKRSGKSLEEYLGKL
ncbi:MAG: M15 family metallopeptidase [Clostridia bacterium]|nr:M15 family metallopeptidase [Clostridia bacterium]